MELGSSTDSGSVVSKSMISANIRGLNPGMSHSKLEYMNDLSKENNAIIISLTFLDPEINIKGWTNKK